MSDQDDDGGQEEQNIPAIQYVTRLEGPPKFKDAHSWQNYKRQLKLWIRTSGAPKHKQGTMIVNALCNDNKLKLNLKNRIFDS